jgi:DHA2 family multidrug resistance protein
MDGKLAELGYIPAKHPVMLVVTVMLSTIITSIDSTIANVALPHMQGSLSATQDQISWVLTSYIVATAILTPPTGFLAARMGRQRLMAWGVGGFLVASMLCGVATSLTEMVIFRILQGAFGAVLGPIGQTLIMDHFPPSKRGMVLSIWGGGAMLGPVIGPTLGGYLTQELTWRWVFFINLPLCLLTLVGVWSFIPKGEIKPDQRFDVFGFSLLSIAIASFQLMLDRGQSANWFQSTEILIEGAAAALSLYMFMVHIYTDKNPFIEPRLFKDRNLVVGLFLAALSSVVLMGQMALLPNFLQQLMQIPADVSGILMLPRGVAAMLAMIVCGRLIGRVDSRWMMALGLVGTALSLYEMSKINLNVDNFTIMRIGFTQGFCMSAMMAPMTSAVFATLLPALRTEGSSMFILARNIGGSIGISLFFTQIAKDSQINHGRLSENITAFAHTDLLPQAWNWSTAAGAMALNGEVSRQASSLAYLNSYTLMTFITLVTIPLCFLFKTPKQEMSPELRAMAVEH